MDVRSAGRMGRSLTSTSALTRALVALLAAIATWAVAPAMAHAAFPGANAKLAFGSARSGYPADNDLYTMASNGTTETRITAMNRDELNPSWSPSGTEIVFERNDGMRSDIWIANANGTNPRRLTTHPGNDTRPAFSNTGTKIVFASDRNGTHGTSDLFVMDASGANQVAITNTPTIDEAFPAWSPDGTAIAFSRDGDIYKISPTGANLTRLTTSPDTEFEPDWSPSSAQIVFRQGINADDELWKVNANGTGLTALAHSGSVPEEHPVWSPQGDKIAFIRGMFKDAEIYTMNPDGSGVTRITNNTFMDASPAWQGIPSAPETTIDSGPSGTTNDGTPTFTFSSSEAGSTFACQIDVGPVAPCTSPHTMATELASGAHTFVVRATGPGGTDLTPASRSFTVDTIAPETTIDTGPSGPTNQPALTFTFSSSETGSTFECRVDAGAFAACISPHTTADLSPGAHTFEVRTTDAVGNTDATAATRSFAVDTTEPETTIDSGPSGTTRDPTPTFTFSSDEPVSSFECRVDGDDYAPCASPFTTHSLPDGPYIFQVRARDLAGNVEQSAASVQFGVDTTPPDTTIVTGSSDLTNDSTPTFTFSGEAGSTFECKLDADSFAPCASPHTTGQLADGPHTFEVRAADVAGNQDTTPASDEFAVDASAPTSTASLPAFTNSDQLVVGYAAGDAAGSGVESVEVWIRGPGESAFGLAVTDTTPDTATVTIGLGDEGEYAVYTRAKDVAGNYEAAPSTADKTTVLDRGTPDSSAAAPGSIETVSFTVSYVTGDSGASGVGEVELWVTRPGDTSYSLAGTDSSPETPVFDFVATGGSGTYGFYTRARDRAGNYEDVPSSAPDASTEVTLENVPPETTITSGPAGTTNDPRPTFSFSASEPGSTFECRLDGGAFGPCGSPFTAPALADGLHVFDVQAIDPSGNPDPSPASLSFVVTSSSGSGTSAPGGGSGGSSAAIAPTPVPTLAPTVQGASSGGIVRVKTTGSFTLGKHLVECPEGGSSCAVKVSVTGSVIASAKRKTARLGGSSYTLVAGKRGVVRVKLTKKGLRLLRRSQRVRATVAIRVTKGATVTVRKVKVTLRAPGKSKP